MAQQNIKSDAKASKAKARKKRKLADVNGAAHIHSTVNNTIVTITDLNGNAITWSSAGAIGYKGSKKSSLHPNRILTQKRRQVKPMIQRKSTTQSKKYSTRRIRH